MFDGDQAQAGRRERLMRKREAKDAYTDKIGGDAKFSSRMDETPSAVPNSVFAGTPSSTAGFQRAQVGSSRQPSQVFDSRSATGSALGNNAADTEEVPGLFKHRVNVKRHAYEVNVWCTFPIVDMTSNAKRRSITWYANVDGAEESFSLQIPSGFDLDAASLLQEDFKSGHCIVSIPAIVRNVFS